MSNFATATTVSVISQLVSARANREGLDTYEKSFLVKEKQFGKYHEVYCVDHSDWAKERGATHTLYCGEGHGRGIRPAIVLKTCMYVGVDEENDQIVWERWDTSFGMRSHLVDKYVHQLTKAQRKTMLIRNEA
jgi:hypothetical protein